MSQIQLEKGPGRPLLLAANRLTQPPLGLRGVVRAIGYAARWIPRWRSYPTIGPDGAPFLLDFSDGHFSWVSGGWCIAHYEHVLDQLANDAVVLDIGANIGVVTRAAAARCRAGWVHAFEPDPFNFRHLQRNCRDYPNIVCHPMALAGVSGRIGFSGAATPSVERYIEPAQSGGRQMVPCQRLDEWCAIQSITRIDLVKIDVEGFEEEILLPAETVLRRFRPAVIFEIGGSVGVRSRHGGRELLPLFQRLGYAVQRFEGTCDFVAIPSS